jgi:hypothetical protein
MADAPRVVFADVVTTTDQKRGDSGLWLSPAPTLHGQRRRESALFDLHELGMLHANPGAGTKRAEASTGFIDVKSIVGLAEHEAPRAIVVPPSRGLVPVMPPQAQAQAQPFAEARDAGQRRVLWAICLGMLAMLAAMAVRILG